MYRKDPSSDQGRNQLRFWGVGKSDCDLRYFRGENNCTFLLYLTTKHVSENSGEVIARFPSQLHCGLARELNKGLETKIVTFEIWPRPQTFRSLDSQKLAWRPTE